MIAPTGGAGWGSIPVAFKAAGAGFNVTNQGVIDFPYWASLANVKPVAGDFNGDGRSDIALTGGYNWGSIPVAFSRGDGTFDVSNVGVSSFPGWSAIDGAKPVAGDFNGDGRADLALTGPNWSFLPVAFSQGNGGFSVTYSPVANFLAWVAAPGAKVMGAF